MAKARSKVRTHTRKSVRKSSVRSTAARSSAGKTAAKTRLKARPTHAFTVSHLNDADFQTGLRSYAHYRDLGIAKATNGMAVAHVIRFVPPCDPKLVSKQHYHDIDFQMVYVLKGWITAQFDGHGSYTMKAGSAWLQPPNIKHRVLNYSDDCEVLEIVLPADFKTVELE
jgi:mannose-6-phosphate isomerase-like protein (cupin superfamily)